jgi:hypothetical protein
LGVSRRQFLRTASTAAIVLAAGDDDAAKGEFGSSGRILLGLTGPVYFNGFSPFLNWWKTASAPTLTIASGKPLFGREIWDHGGYLDPSSGEIVSPAPSDLMAISRTFYKSANSFQVKVGCNYDGEEWTAQWDGSASGHVSFQNAGGAQSMVGTNQIDFTTGSDPDKVALVLTLTNRNDPPRNVRIFQARYRANADNAEKFNPDWLAQIRQFGTLRFMGWMPTNNETISEFSQLADESYFAWGQEFVSLSNNGEFGPKGSMHPELICTLANATGCNIHVCIPIRASDAFVLAFAEYFRGNTGVEVTYELSNECWNPGFNQFHYCREQGSKTWPDDFWGFSKWYGYRSAECMNIIRNVYKDANRWRGALATQTVDVAKTINALAGVNYWRKHTLKPRRSLQVSDLFKSLYVTGYFGFGVSGQKIANIANSHPVICTSPKHGFENGQKIKMFLTDGPVQLNDTVATVTNRTENSFELLNISTAGMGTYLPPCRFATSATVTMGATYANGVEGENAALTALVPGRFLINGIAATEGDAILIKDRPEREQNGIYHVTVAGDDITPWQLVRVPYFDRSSKMIAGSSTQVIEGLDAGHVYALAETIHAVGRDIVSFSKVKSNNYACDASLFEVMDVSSAKHIGDPVAFPDKFSYFNQQIAHALRYGSCDAGLTVSECVSAMENVYWPRHFAVAKAYGLSVRQYEGGCGLGGTGAGLLGDPRALVYGGNRRFGEYIFNFGHSQEAAGVYRDNYAAFLRLGGEYPAKFVADGRSSNVGTWAGVRFWPLKANANVSDAGNAVWQATRTAAGLK